MPGKLVSRMSERECHTLNETDTIKLASQKLDEKKPTKKKATKKGADATQDPSKAGAVLKKPLSAYMLYNNHRRPVLRSEYPSKYSVYTIGYLLVIFCC